MATDEDLSQFDKVSDALISLLDIEASRKVLLNNFDFGKLLSRLDEIVPGRSSRGSGRDVAPEEKELLIGICKFVKKTLLSPSGLFFFLKNKSYLEYLIEALKQPLHTVAKKHVLGLFEHWFRVFLGRTLPPYFGILAVHLFAECGFYDTLMELSMAGLFQKQTRLIARLFLCLAYECLDRSAIPSYDHLFYSMRPRRNRSDVFDQKQHGEQTFVSKIESILENNSEILFETLQNSQFLYK